jgi:hypothetical protein
VPYDAAFVASGEILAALNAKVLIVTAGLLDTAIEDYEIVHDLQESIFSAELEEVSVQPIFVFEPGLLPGEVVLLGGLGRAVP